MLMALTLTFGTGYAAGLAIDLFVIKRQDTTRF
jgi:hypothetical protein